MKAIILAAGTGTRLLPLTEKIPKCLIEIYDKTILEKIIDSCLHVGINDFTVVTGHGKKFVTERLSRSLYRNASYNIVENTNYKDTNTGVSLSIALKNIDDTVVIVNGDLIFDEKILNLLINQNRTAIIIDNAKKLTEESFKVKLENKNIKLMGKNISINEADGEFIGLSLIKCDDIYMTEQILEKLISENKHQYYDFVFQELSKIGLVDFIFTNGLKWTEIDTLDDLKYAKKIAQYLNP